MRAFILIGSENKKSDYINKYIEDNLVPSFNTLLYTDPLKISDARQIIKSLNFTTSGGKKRVVIIKADPNIESQNALLKTLEELDSETDFIFAGSINLLTTVISRSTIINLGFQDVNADKSVSFGINLIETDEKLKFIEQFFLEKREDPIKEIILNLRSKLLLTIKDNNNFDIKILFKTLRNVTKSYPLVRSNNLNAKLVLERLFLEPN